MTPTVMPTVAFWNSLRLVDIVLVPVLYYLLLLLLLY